MTKIDARVREILRSMTLEQKVGQMFLLAFAGPDPVRAERMIREHFLGGCYLSNENAETPSAACDLSRALQGYAMSSGSRIPLLLGADQEGAWGVMMPASTTGPGNLGLGAAHDPRSTAAMYRVIGEELRSVGYNTLFAPCVDVNANPRNSIIGMRSFGEDPGRVGRHAAAAVRGAGAAGVITTAKHFPGHGDTGMDSHRNMPRVDRSRAEVERIDLAPFRSAIREDVDIVMTSHILFPAIDPDNPATLSSAILTGLLRGEMGFRGVILSDSMNMGAIRKNYGPADSSVRAVRAGVDMIMLAEEHYDHDQRAYETNQLACIDGVLAAVKSGIISEALVDGAVSRILEVKARHGLLSAAMARPDGRAVGTAAHRKVENAVAEKTVTVVRNAGVLPVPRESRLALVRTVPAAAYAILTATRGIGPNQGEPAFDAFSRAVQQERLGVPVIAAEEASDPAAIAALATEYDIVVAVTEDYPLPGVDFDTTSQKRLVKSLASRLLEKLVVVALRSPYELSEYADVATYVCTCSSRACSARAAARAVLGRIRMRGTLPVTPAVD